VHKPIVIPPLSVLVSSVLSRLFNSTTCVFTEIAKSQLFFKGRVDHSNKSRVRGRETLLTATITRLKQEFLNSTKADAEFGSTLVGICLKMVYCDTWQYTFSLNSLNLSQALQGLGRLKKPPPIISISGPGPPVPDSHLLSILIPGSNPRTLPGSSPFRVFLSFRGSFFEF